MQYAAPKIILRTTRQVPKNPTLVSRLALTARSSPKKLRDPGVEILAIIKVKNKDDKSGIATPRPL
jgi:hypothetical protein